MKGKECNRESESEAVRKGTKEGERGWRDIKHCLDESLEEIIITIVRFQSYESAYLF